MEPFAFSADIALRYGVYIRTAFPIRDDTLAQQFREKIVSEQLLGTGPIVSFQRPFATGERAIDLAASGTRHGTVASMFPSDWELGVHQLAALDRLSEAGGFRSTIVAAGTGSGKTEAFLLPILDFCARHPGPGGKAVIVHPLNPLANEQLERLRTYLHGTGITFGRYTGYTPPRAADAHPAVLGANQSTISRDLVLAAYAATAGHPRYDYYQKRVIKASALGARPFITASRSLSVESKN